MTATEHHLLDFFQTGRINEYAIGKSYLNNTNLIFEDKSPIGYDTYLFEPYYNVVKFDLKIVSMGIYVWDERFQSDMRFLFGVENLVLDDLMLSFNRKLISWDISRTYHFSKQIEVLLPSGVSFEFYLHEKQGFTLNNVSIFERNI